MKIAVIQASTQADKNKVLTEIVKKVASPLGHEIVNFGVFEDEANYSYTEIALLISILLSSKSVDFIITGCSSGQGMALACNTLPGVLCGFVQNPQDAFLFGRINDGNAISFPLGLGYGWLGELNLEYSLEKLFAGEFGIGYPAQDADRKVRETDQVKAFNKLVKRNISWLLKQLERPIVEKLIAKTDVLDYIMKYGQDEQLEEVLINLREKETA